ncbi:MAG: hypothetical protein QOH31_5262 [Verrucomicrobiota bacterium]|jgi:hypothetical protein
MPGHRVVPPSFVPSFHKKPSGKLTTADGPGQNAEIKSDNPHGASWALRTRGDFKKIWPLFFARSVLLNRDDASGHGGRKLIDPVRTGGAKFGTFLGWESFCYLWPGIPSRSVGPEPGSRSCVVERTTTFICQISAPDDSRNARDLCSIERQGRA